MVVADLYIQVVMVGINRVDTTNTIYDPIYKVTILYELLKYMFLLDAYVKYRIIYFYLETRWLEGNNNTSVMLQYKNKNDNEIYMIN